MVLVSPLTLLFDSRAAERRILPVSERADVAAQESPALPSERAPFPASAPPSRSTVRSRFGWLLGSDGPQVPLDLM